MGEVLLGCSGWTYPDTADKGGWTGVLYPDKDTKRLRYYSQFFSTAEMEPSFYDRFYPQMTKGTFIGMARGTPEKFQFSIKVPETITHVKRLDVNKGAITYFEEFLIKYPLQKSWVQYCSRIASFEKRAPTEAKRLVNRSSLLPDDARILARQGGYNPRK